MEVAVRGRDGAAAWRERLPKANTEKGSRLEPTQEPCLEDLRPEPDDDQRDREERERESTREDDKLESAFELGEASVERCIQSFHSHLACRAITTQ